MAEFLIYAKKHWMDERLESNPNWLDEKQLHIDANPALTDKQKIKNKTVILNKYRGRYQPGDIVEVQDDGFYGEPSEKNKHGWNHKVFALLKVPKMKKPNNLAKANEYFKAPFHVKYLNLSAGEIKVIDKRDYRVEKKHGD